MRDKNMKYPRLALLGLPYARLELLGWGKMLIKLGVYSDELWRQAPTVKIRGKWHGYLMTLDLSNWSERQTYFLGRFYDLPTQLFMKAAIRPGDSFIDVGANIGMISLLAAHLVGEEGIVYAFEPNPVASERSQAVFAQNQLPQVKLYPWGLGAQQTELTLSVITAHTGMGTLAQVPEKDRSQISNQYQVAVYRGDDVLPNDLPGVTFIKIDVEGFEPYVIQGLDRTIRRHKPVVLTEVFAEYLERAGSSVEELFTLMHDYGYTGFNMDAKRVIGPHRLQLCPVSPDRIADNVVWLHRDNNLSEQLQPYLVA
jgi:FkbM family methyltransferase